MDLNLEYATHQRALMSAKVAANDDDRRARLAKASHIAGRISEFQHRLGAAAACAWSNAQCVAAAKAKKKPETAF